MAQGRNVGVVLKAARLEAGLSVRDLERASGVTTALIAKLESGSRPDPSFRTIERLAAAIGISLDEVASRARGGAKAESAPSEASRAKALAALDKAAKTTDSARAAIDAAVAVLAPTAKKKTGRRRPT